MDAPACRRPGLPAPPCSNDWVGWGTIGAPAATVVHRQFGVTVVRQRCLTASQAQPLLPGDGGRHGPPRRTSPGTNPDAFSGVSWTGAEGTRAGLVAWHSGVRSVRSWLDLLGVLLAHVLSSCSRCSCRAICSARRNTQRPRSSESAMIRRTAAAAKIKRCRPYPRVGCWRPMDLPLVVERSVNVTPRPGCLTAAAFSWGAYRFADGSARRAQGVAAARRDAARGHGASASVRRHRRLQSCMRRGGALGEE